MTGVTLNQCLDREMPADMEVFDYAAFFAHVLVEGDEVVQVAARWARERGVNAVLSFDGRPFIGMKCVISLEPITDAEARELKALLRPDMESAIPQL